MIYTKSEYKEATEYFEMLKNKGARIEIKNTSKRTLTQNKALHKFFQMIADELNNLGQEFKYVGVKGVELSTMYTPFIVKNFFWRPIQMTLFEIESTTELNSEQINKIVDVIIKFFGEKGIFITFPSKEYE